MMRYEMRCDDRGQAEDAAGGGMEKKLEEMRQTDEKLQSSRKDRFDHSFKLITGQLEAVQKGLGEMQNLGTLVGDLKKVC